jgi:head-tail adaptor
MPVCLCANDLNRYVMVRQLKTTLTQDASGHVDKVSSSSWQDVANEWCQFISQGSREFVIGDELQQTLSHQVTMRWSPRAAAYTAGMRLEYDGRIFNIAGPPQNVDEKDKWLRFGVIESGDA